MGDSVYIGGVGGCKQLDVRRPYLSGLMVLLFLGLLFLILPSSRTKVSLLSFLFLKGEVVDVLEFNSSDPWPAEVFALERQSDQLSFSSSLALKLSNVLETLSLDGVLESMISDPSKDLLRSLDRADPS